MTKKSCHYLMTETIKRIVRKKFAQRLKKYVRCIHREIVMICTASLLYINEK